jgi:lipopolysaccharide transport system ATP-binding protein
VVRLRSVRAVDQFAVTTPSVDVREPVGIEIVLEVMTDGPAFVPWIALYTEQGAHVFSAMDIDPGWRLPRPPGRYKTTAWVPANLLNEGAVLISVSLNSFVSGGRSERRAHVDEAVVVNVRDSGEADTARGHYGGTWPGPVRPLLDWATEYEPAGNFAQVRTKAP